MARKDVTREAVVGLATIASDAQEDEPRLVAFIQSLWELCRDKRYKGTLCKDKEKTRGGCSRYPRKNPHPRLVLFGSGNPPEHLPSTRHNSYIYYSASQLRQSVGGNRPGRGV